MQPTPSSARRVAIYTRFSTDRQNERSCADQEHLCRAWAAREDAGIVATYEDRAVSGSSMVNRAGIQRLLRDARERRFDTVLCEHVDRLSRDQADLALIRRELRFLDIEIVTLQDGVVGAMHVGLKGLMSEMFLADLAQRTRRGLSGRVREGRSAGGRSYGYRPDPAATGRLLVVEAEAAIVRRIFAAYLGGSNSRAIAMALNADRIPGPRGGRWNASTIHGNAQRMNGILQNRLYVGELVWNRQRFVKDPATGKRISRPNPAGATETSAVPELAILDRDTFEAVQRRRAALRQVHPAHQRRPQHVLSGLLRCGCCGASYTVFGAGRIGCAGHRERGDCTNNRTVTLKHVEDRVLAALRDELASPDLQAEYVRAYHAAAARLEATTGTRRSDDERRLAELSAAIERTVDLLLDESGPKALMARLRAMEAEADSIRAGLAASAAPAVRLQPDAPARYRKMVEDLATQLRGLKQGAPAERLVAAVRSLISAVHITPAPESKKPVRIDVDGLLDRWVSDALPEYGGVLVAGAGFEPATFRL